VALYILNHKRAVLAAMEERFGVRITAVIDEHITGTQLFMVEKGETAQRSEPRVSDPSKNPVHVDDAGTIEDEPEELAAEEESAEDEAPRQKNGDTDESRRRKRRRRRGGRDRDREPGEGSRGDRQRDERASTAASASDDPDSEPDGGADEDGDANGISPRNAVQSDNDVRRKRRRRRGGRRNRRDRDGEDGQNAGSGNGASEPVTPEEPVVVAMPQQEASEDKPKPRGRGRKPKTEEAAAASTGETVSDAPSLIAEKPKRSRAKKANAASETTVSVRSANSDPVVEPAAVPATEEASKPARRRVPIDIPLEPEAEDSGKPKRAGWWSKAKQIIGGE
jgi:ribonuclease E